MKSKKLLDSFKYAFSGIFAALKSERNMKIHFTAMIFVIVCGMILKISTYEWIACIFCFALVIGSELINTTLEMLSDLVMPDYNENVKLIKDMAAGAVLVLAICSAIIGLIIFIPKILLLL